MAVKWKWKPAAGGGNVPADLTNKVNQLETNTVKITGDQSIAGVKTFTSNNEAIKLNSGNNNSAYIAGYKSGNSRIWYFGKGSSTSDELVIGSTSNIKLEATNIIHCNSKKLTNVADPAANTDAATKQYVDTKIRKRVIDIQNRQNTTYTIEPVQGYEILSVMVGRKRNSDGFYFFQSNINLNFQVFLHTDGKYKIYTQGPATDFGPDFRIIVVEMKV